MKTKANRRQELILPLGGDFIQYGRQGVEGRIAECLPNGASVAMEALREFRDAAPAEVLKRLDGT